jgi:predicted ferric reductase
MAQRNPTAEQRFPWAGWIAVGAASLFAGASLGAPSLVAGILNTWYLTRAAGLVAFGLLYLSTVIGLLQSTGLFKGAAAPAAALDIHNFVSLGALYATIFHMVVLLFNEYTHWSLTDILIPFASAYKPLLSGLGGIGFYIALLVIVTSYLRNKLNAKTWRTIHLFSLGGFVLVLLHGVLMGSDTQVPWVAYMYRFSALSIAVLTCYRIYLGVTKHANPARGR